MRNLKKFLSLLLAVMMVATAGIVVSAEDEADYSEATTVLHALDVLKGYPDGSLGENDPVERYQMALFIARMMTGKLDDALWADASSVAFEDMEGYTQFYGAIDYVYNLGIIKGVSTDALVFNPAGHITLDEAITMACRSLGFDSKAWPVDFRIFAEDFGLLVNLEDVEWKAELNRAQTAQLLYNMIRVVSGWELGDEIYDYADNKFPGAYDDFDEIEVFSDNENGVWYDYFCSEGEVVTKIACPEVDAKAADAYYTLDGKETEDYKYDQTEVAYFELYDGTIVGVVTVDVFPAGAEEVVARFVEFKDGSVIFKEPDVTFEIGEANIKGAPVVTEAEAKALAREKLYTITYYGDIAVKIEAVDETNEIAILKDVALEEDEDGNFTGYMLATVLFEHDGFAKETEIKVRTLANGTLNFETEWIDALEDDATLLDEFFRDKHYDAFLTILAALQGDCAWVVNTTRDARDLYDLTIADLYDATLETINEFATDNVQVNSNGVRFNVVTKDGKLVIETNADGTPKIYDRRDGYTTYYEYVKPETAEYTAEGRVRAVSTKIVTITGDTKWVVVNRLTGLVEIFEDEPEQGDRMTGHYAYKDIVKDGYVVVVVDENSADTGRNGRLVGFDLAPRATYVQVANGLTGYVKLNKSTVEVGTIKIPVYSYDYTVKGIKNYATGEDIELKFEALNEAQFLALKAEMSLWEKYLVPEYIYRFFQNDGDYTEAVVPFMFFQVATFAQYWEEYDIHEVVLENVEGCKLLDEQTFWFEAFDFAAGEFRGDEYKYNMHAVKYMAYPDLDSDAIDQHYSYDIGVDFDEEKGLLKVYYEKVGALVQPIADDYDYDTGIYYLNNGENKPFGYSVEYDMPGYVMGYDDLDEWFRSPRRDVYVPFGTQLVVYTAINPDQTAETKPFTEVKTLDVEIQVGCEKQKITLTNGVPYVAPVAHKDAIPMIPNTGSVNLATEGKNVFIEDRSFGWFTWSERVVHAWKEIEDPGDLKAFNPYAAAYIYWEGHDDLEVSYQKWNIDVKAHVIDLPGGEYAIDATSEKVVAEKWDEVEVYNWKVDEDRSDDLLTADDLGTSYVKLIDGEVEAVEYGYYTRTKYENQEYYYTEYTKAEYLAQFKDGKEANGFADGKDKGIRPWQIILVPNYITLNFSEPCVDKLSDKFDIAFVVAYDDEGKAIDYKENWNNVYVEDDVMGWALDCVIDGGQKFVAEVLEVKKVLATPAYAFVKVMIDENRKAYLLEVDPNEWTLDRDGKNVAIIDAIEELITRGDLLINENVRLAYDALEAVIARFFEVIFGL